MVQLSNEYLFSTEEGTLDDDKTYPAGKGKVQTELSVYN